MFFLENLLNENAFIHGIENTFDFLVVLMAFSCQDNDISRFSMGNAVADGFLSVTDFHILSFGAPDADFDVINNRLGFLVSGVIGSNDRQVCQFSADLSHLIAAQAGAQYEEIHELSRQERMEEFMFLGLRLTGGVRTAEFERRFGVTMEAVYGEVIERLLKEGLLEASAQTDSHIRLTEYGLDVSTYALAEFLQ